MKNLTALLFCLLVAGCGFSPSIHYRNQEQIQQIAEEYEGREIKSKLKGYTIWETLLGETISCDIYILFPEMLSAEEFKELLDHEERHCYEFDFHQPWE